MKKIKAIKKDILLVCGLFLVGGAVALCLLVFGGSGKSVQIRSNSKTAAVYPLSENRSVTLHDDAGGSNILVIEDGQAWISEADCPDGLCMKTGKISLSGQSIICLPHKLVVEITDAEADSASRDIDIYVK